MKKMTVLMLLFATYLAAADYSGIWNGQGGFESAKYGTVPAVAQMTLLQAGNSLQGTFQLGNNNLMTISSGSVSGTQVTLVLNNGTVTATLNDNGSGQLTGKMTSSSGDVADFVFTKR